MATFNTYQQPAAETPLARKWFIWALVASLVIHAVLYFAFRATKLENFTPPAERLVPRAFTSLGRVEVNENLLSDDPEKKQPDQQSAPKPAPQIDVPQDKPAVDANPQDLVYTPTAPEAVKPIATENPKATNPDLKTLAKMPDSTSHDLDNELKKVSEQLIKDKNPSDTKPLLKFSDNTGPGSSGNPAGGGETAIPGTKSLDAALSNTGGGLQNGDKIGIHGGALFEYDSAELRPDAMNELKKLAAVVKKYPEAVFSIEGYADSFGTPEYNLDLSQRRADTVKSWLLLTVGVNPDRIEAKGYGSTKFVAPPTGTVEEQEKNRRVEIGIKFPH